MSCNCIEQVNKTLKPRNARLSLTLSFSARVQARPTIMVEKIDTKKRGTLPAAWPTYCPFCGSKYEEGVN